MRIKTNEIPTLALIGIIIIIGITWLYAAAGHNSQTEKLKQAATETQTATDKAKTNYTEIKNSNIQKERSVAKNAVKTLYCDVYSSDADILIGFAELCDRAKAYNARQLGKLGNGSD